MATEMAAEIEKAAKAAPASRPRSTAPPSDLAEASSLELDAFQESAAEADAIAKGIGLLSDVELQVKVELGRTHKTIEEVLALGTGSVVELDRLAGDPVDILVNERLVARGEVLVLNDNLCIRVNQIVSRHVG
jgi:flagellar motor switch protein FliN/FliY